MLLQKGLAPVINPMNSILIEKKFVNVDTKFIQLVSIAENLPRTTVKLDLRSYVDRSKGIIQIRSSARIGQSDLGVNQRRINYLLKQLENLY